AARTTISKQLPGSIRRTWSVTIRTACGALPLAAKEGTGQFKLWNKSYSTLVETRHLARRAGEINDNQRHPPCGPHSPCELRRFSGIRRARQGPERGICDARQARRLRDESQYGKPEGKRAEGPATGLASERQAERRPISNYEYLRSIPSRAKRGSSEDDF